MAFYRPQMLGSDGAAPLLIENMPQTYISVANRMTLNNTKNWKDPFWYNLPTMVKDIEAMQDDNWRVRNPLENCYVKAGMRHTIFFKDWMDYEYVVEKVPVPSPDSYFARLDVEVEPKDYLTLLAKHLQAGICLRPYLPWLSIKACTVNNEIVNWKSKDGSGLYVPRDYPSDITYSGSSHKNTGHVYLPVSAETALAAPKMSAVQVYEGKVIPASTTGPMTFPVFREPTDFSIRLDNSTFHRPRYVQAVKNFREVINFKIMELTGQLLYTANMDDLPTLEHAYNMFINRYNNFFDVWINAKYNFFVQSGADFSVRPFSTSIPSNEEDGPLVDFGSPISFAAFVGVRGTDVVLPAVDFPAVCDCRTAIKRIVREELSILYANITKLEAAIAARRDPKAAQSTTTFVRDPLQNPFQVYNMATGRFVNVAANLNVRVEQEPVTIDPRSGVTAAHYAAAPSIRSLYLRNHVTSEGAKVSQSDIQRAGGGIVVGKLIPWLVGGAAAAAALGVFQ